jgi:hypothetical protein
MLCPRCVMLRRFAGAFDGWHSEGNLESSGCSELEHLKHYFLV